MQEILREKSVMAMYDVRGIQSYIFRTNEMREIIGASVLVENIIIKGLGCIIEKNGWEKRCYLTEWENDDAEAFLKNEQIQMQVMFIGGGNAYVLFRKGEICEQVNRQLAKYVLDHTYSLNLAAAVIEKSESYREDYEQINREMRRIKATMPETRPMGAMPFMAVDSITGYPLTEKIVYDDSVEYICTEASRKRKHFPKVENAEKILDNMVTEKGDNSSLAIVHIDGNNMGGRIKQIMEDKEDYATAIKTMRMISKNIKYGFQDTFHVMEQAIQEISDRIKPRRKGELYRKVIVAGDDITFICNARAAMIAVETFLKDISKHLLYREEGLSDDENRQKYGFSACAGISYFNSHFPFCDAYDVAEECCKSAKAKAKTEENRNQGQKDGSIGCFVDFQICTHIKAADLRVFRERHYQYTDREGLIINRPYYVPCSSLDSITDLNERNSDSSIDILWKNLKYFTGDEKGQQVKRSRAKRLRNAYAIGWEDVDKQITFLKSRDTEFPDTEPETWYDALEIMDICDVGEERKDEA